MGRERDLVASESRAARVFCEEETYDSRSYDATSSSEQCVHRRRHTRFPLEHKLNNNVYYRHHLKAHANRSKFDWLTHCLLKFVWTALTTVAQRIEPNLVH